MPTCGCVCVCVCISTACRYKSLYQNIWGNFLCTMWKWCSHDIIFWTLFIFQLATRIYSGDFHRSQDLALHFRILSWMLIKIRTLLFFFSDVFFKGGFRQCLTGVNIADSVLQPIHYPKIDINRHKHSFSLVADWFLDFVQLSISAITKSWRQWVTLPLTVTQVSPFKNLQAITTSALS